MACSIFLRRVVAVFTKFVSFPALTGIVYLAKVKVCFYIAQYPVRWTAQSALHVTPWQTWSLQHQLDFSGKHSSHAASTREYYLITFPPLCQTKCAKPKTETNLISRRPKIQMICDNSTTQYT